MAKEKKLVEAITSMEEDFAQWYTDVVIKAELIDYSSVKGCMIIKPAGYAIWENIQSELDRRFKETGVENVYMPMFIPESLLQVEKDHAAAIAKLESLSSRIQNSSSQEETAALAREMSQAYVDYYRNCVKYVLQNSKSLTSVPVLYQNFGADLPVFAQSTDAMHFVAVSDSLSTVYPESKYVKALKKEAERRYGF